MSAMPTVSICLPVYNGAAFLSAALDSCLSQSFEDFEIVVCDDQSTDDSAAIVKMHAGADGRIQYMQNEIRLGLFENYNQCLRLSKGKFAKFMAQDDILYPTALQRMTDCLNVNSSAVLVASERQLVDETGNEITSEVAKSLLSEGLHDGIEVVRKMLKTCRNLIGEPVATMIRRLDGGNFLTFDTRYKSLGDMDLWMRQLRRGNAYFESEPVVAFRQHPNSTTSNLLRDMTWVLDFMLLGKCYRSEIEAMGWSLDEFYFEALKAAGSLMDKFVSEGNEIADFTGFKEVAFYAMRKLQPLEHQRDSWEIRYNSVVNSTSWKVTDPLRRIRRKFNKE